MPEPIVTSNEESLRSDLRELVRKTVEDTLNGLPGAEADELAGAGRHGRTAEREAHRAGHHGRGPATSSGEATIHMPKLKRATRDGGHRALPQARDRRRGGDDRDAPRRGLDQEDRGRLRDPLGARRLGGDRSRPQREGVRLGRGVAEPPARPGPPLRLRRRRLPEAQPGRRVRERGRHGGHRRQRRWLPRGRRRRRGLHGVVGSAGGNSRPGCGPEAFTACG